MTGASSYVFGLSIRSGGSGDEAGGREGALGPGRWTQIVEYDGEGTVVTRGAGAWPGGHMGSGPELQERAHAVQTKARGCRRLWVF